MRWQTKKNTSGLLTVARHFEPSLNASADESSRPLISSPHTPQHHATRFQSSPFIPGAVSAQVFFFFKSRLDLIFLLVFLACSSSAFKNLDGREGKGRNGAYNTCSWNVALASARSYGMQTSQRSMRRVKKEKIISLFSFSSYFVFLFHQLCSWNDHLGNLGKKSTSCTVVCS